MFDFSAERTLQSVEESLKRLGLEYIDVIQVQKTLFMLDSFGNSSTFTPLSRDCFVEVSSNTDNLSSCALLLDTSAPFLAIAFCCHSNQVFTYSMSQVDRVK